MAGYKIQAKKTDGSLVDIPLAATYDDSGKKISEEYATQETVSDIIDGTTKVGKAGEADTATSADHATSADSAISAQSATKATQDSEGNSIIDTYVNKSELGDKCILYTEAQSLTSEQQAQARENIGVVGTGEDGVGWFPAAWGAGAATDLAVDEEIYNVINIGDYVVQSNDRTEVNKGGGLVYESLGLGSVWQVTSKSYSGGFYFVNTTPLNFTIRGAKGEDADPNSVLYVAQTLTDEQKQQARANIGAITASEAEVPVASQTQFGTVKVYTDSDGYLCIDTE